MKIDLYTKTILTLIAIFLMIVALRPLIPGPVSAADGKFAHVQFSGASSFFDQRTGDIWNLWGAKNYEFEYIGRVEAMGKFRRAGSR